MWISFTDLESNKITINSALIAAIMVPSPLTRGDGKCRILVGTLLTEVSRAEAVRVRDEVMGTLKELNSLAEATKES